jgi:DNA polymerase-1
MINKYQALINELRLRQEDDEAVHKNSRVLIVDGLNTFIRAYAASPVTNSDGEHVGGISGFLMSVGHAIKAINPTRLVIVFDGKDGSARRRSIYPDYKAKRKVTIRLNRSETVDKEDNQLVQLMRLTEYLDVMPLTTLVADKAEADDVIAYISNDYLEQKDSQVFIMSSDKDFMQLVDDRTHVWSPTKKKMFYAEDVLETYGVLPANFALFRSLIGDDSDCIPGVNGVGDKTVWDKFPKLATDNMTIDEFFIYANELATSNPKMKIYQKVAEAEKDVRLYFEIIQLGVSNINMSSKMKIIGMMEQPHNKLAKIKFHTMLIEDRMTTAIRNVEMWLKETTSKLDKYILED